MTAQHAAGRQWYVEALDWAIDRLAALATRLSRTAAASPDPAPSSAPRDGAAALPLPATPGQGQHPYAHWPLYGVRHDGLVSVDADGQLTVTPAGGSPAADHRETAPQPVADDDDDEPSLVRPYVLALLRAS